MIKCGGASGPPGISAAKKGIWGNVSGTLQCSFMHPRTTPRILRLLREQREDPRVWAAVWDAETCPSCLICSVQVRESFSLPHLERTHSFHPRLPGLPSSHNARVPLSTGAIFN